VAARTGSTFWPRDWLHASSRGQARHRDSRAHLMVARRNDWLDLCRALAILMVLLSHGRVFLRPTMPWAEYFRFGGFFGVELFFVLSGFLIGGILIRLSRKRGTHWLRGFYARRWFRTLPNYYLFVLINILLVWGGIRTGELDAIWKYLLFVQNLFGPHPLFFPEAWSLALEEVFYLLFPASFLLLGRLTGLPAARSILVVALAVIALSLLARLLVASSVANWDEEIRKVVFLRFDSLMFGVLLAWVYDRRPRWLKTPGLAAGMVLIFVSSVMYFALTPDAALNQSVFAKTLYLSLAPIGCAGLLLVGIERTLPGWLSAAGRFVARISYSAYLVNIPVALTLVHLFGCCDNSVFQTFGMWLAFMVLTLAISHVVYEAYEKRFNALRDRLFPATAAAVRGTPGHA
jgi:peptidoglycan/LPS O-acetylase OafA/YrhL